MTARALIVGCGDLGTEVGLRLAARGYEVHGARRDPSVLPPPLVPVVCDLEGDLGALPRGLELVVHTPAAGGRGADGYARIYRDGLRRVLEHLDAAGERPRRVLFVSATSVHGDAGGGWVDEDTPPAPDKDTGRVLVEAEQLLSIADVPGTSLRLSGIYGPGRTRLIDTVRDGTARLPRGDHPTNRIHRDDAAAAVVHLLVDVADPAPVYIGTDREPAQLADVLRFLADELGVPHPPEADAEDAPARGGGKRVRGDRLRATGFGLTYPTYREGYRAVLTGVGRRHP